MENENGSKVRGNAVALKIAAPASMDKMIRQGDAVNAKIEVAGKKDSYYTEISEDGSYALVIVKVENGYPGADSFKITWGPEGKSQITQTVQVRLATKCYIEEIPNGAALPRAIAFNGLNTTMYAGQSQNISTIITKKYEGDVTRLSYSSSAPSILSVNRVTGKIDALKAGRAVITVEAIDADGNTVKRAATITVYNPTAPSGIRVSAVKDTSVTVSWSRNLTGQDIDVAAFPYQDEMGKNAAQWKTWIESKMTETDYQPGALDGVVVAYADTNNDTQVEVHNLQKDTNYIFYVYNRATTAAGDELSFGNVSAKTLTKKEIFADITLSMYDVSGTKVETFDSFKGTEKPGDEGLPYKLVYTLKDIAGKDMADGVFTSVGFRSTNTNVLRVTNRNNSGVIEGILSLGGQAGTAELYVTGRDSSGTVRESQRITLTVEKVPTALADKTTTLTIGQSITLKELIGYNVRGTADQFNTENVDFASALKTLMDTGCFVKTQDDSVAVDGDTEIAAAALLPNGRGVPASGAAVTAYVALNGTGKDGQPTILSNKRAIVKIVAMSAPSVRRVTTEDTTIKVQFTPNSTVRVSQWDAKDYYYTVLVTDTVTGVKTELRQNVQDASGMGVAFGEDANSTEKKPQYVVFVYGLSSNKRYQVAVIAHYDASEAQKNERTSNTVTFNTRQRLLASEGSIDVQYISMTELTDKPNSEGYRVNYETERLTLENNETYVLMAQVSNLARTLETDKLRWTISSGDRNAATIKASSSTFEAQLKAVRTGIFTVTATSTVTGEQMVTFEVQVVPYQSGGKTTLPPQSATDSKPVAYVSDTSVAPGDEKKEAE